MPKGHKESLYFPEYVWARLRKWQEREKDVYRTPGQLIQGEITRRAFEEFP